MKHLIRPLNLIILSILSIWLSSASANETVSRGEIQGGLVHAAPDWFKDSFLEIADDVEEAAEENKHVLLFFQLNGCPYCDRMLTENFKSGPVKNYIQENFDVIAINVRGDREIAFNEDVSVTEKELSELLNVRATPGIMFLNSDNKPVVRVDGYRASERFSHILKYVSNKAYESQKLSDYLDQHLQEIYALQPNPMFKDISDLSTVKGPLAVIFEDSRCYDCPAFHEKLLNNPEVQQEMSVFTVVRLNTESDATIKDIAGNETTARALSESLSMTYRPGVAIYADGELLRRHDSLLFSHHFKEGLRWIGSGAYKTEDYPTYSARRTEELLAGGVNINLGQ
ncbi:MAG: thioredoxin-related protein [Gammaproteobacteria bacterium]|jgi:thioredoxin-related protein